MARYKSRGLRGNWTEYDMTKAIQAVKRDKMKVATAAKHFNVPRRTLRRYIAEKKETKSNLGRKPLLSCSQEKLLASRIIRLCNVGYPLTQNVLRTCVKKFCERNGISSSSQGVMIGRDWLRGFLRRHSNISRRKAQNLNPARAQKLNKAVVSDYFAKLRDVLTENDIMNKPERIFNIDEKGCQLNLHKAPQVLAERGTKRVHIVAPEHGENVTIVACASALGHAIPPMILFKGKRMKPEWLDNLPAGSEAQMTPKGSMNIDTFVNWIHHFAKYKLPGPCLLIFDGAKCHLDYSIVDAAEKFEIKLFCLPSNTTHELQPLDKSVFRSYEYHWDEEVLKYWSIHEDRKITKQRFGALFSKVWDKAATPANIKAGFESTGIYPFNPDKIPEEAYAPSIPTFNPGMTENSEVENEIISNINLVDDPADSDATNVSDSVLAHQDFILENQINCTRKGNIDSRNETFPDGNDIVNIDRIMYVVHPPSVNTAKDEDSVEDVPLSQLKKDKNRTNELNLDLNLDPELLDRSYESFLEILKTPEKVSTPKGPPRAKAINSLAQPLTKSTFSERYNKPGPSNVVKVQKTKLNYGKTGNKQPKKTSKTVNSKKSNPGTSTESWYCFLCQVDRVTDMRPCFVCGTYVHEECVGLTIHDKEKFVCIKCTKD